jgi:aminoglycoside N3'-acetyltransferase
MRQLVPKAVRRRLKPLHHRLQAAYFETFHSFSREDLQSVLGNLGVEIGDVICVHSSLNKFVGFTGNVADVVGVLQDAVGTEGGLMMPTQPFGGSAVDYVQSGAITDVARTPSLMGLITEVMRRCPEVRRSINPTHPVAVWGSKGMQLLGNDWEADTPCGRHTAYHRLLQHHGKVVTLGTGVAALTFYHCVEELIEPMFPDSPFTSERFACQTRDTDGSLYSSKIRLFDPLLSARRDMNLLVPELKASGCWKEARVGRLRVLVLETTGILRACRRMAEKGEFCYRTDS